MAECSVSVQGSANQSIIITGDHNQVGGAVEFRIPLVRHHTSIRRRRSRQVPANVLDILSAHNKALSLQGRERELTLLNEWLNEDTDISVFAITAPAGSGKTRLAIELCEQAEQHSGWAAGFVRSSDLAELARAFKFAQANWSHSLLLVVDYAGANAQALAQWLDALSQLDEPENGTRVRILLLEREASKEAGWWHTLTGSALGSDQARLDLFTQYEPFVLTGLSDITARRSVLCAALNAAQALVPHPNVSKVPEANEQPDFDSALADTQFGNPLALVMAGILSRDMSPRAALSLHYLAAAEKLAQREIDRFYKCFGEGADATKLAHCLCFHLLCGGLRIADMRQTLSAELIAMGWHTPSLDKELLALQQAFPPAEDGDETVRLSTTQPDLIAEAMCIQLLQSDRERSLKAPDILARTLEYGQEQAAAALVRLLQDFASPVSQPSAQQAQLLQWTELLVEDNQHNPALLVLLNDAMPLSSIALAEIDCKLAMILCQYSRNQAEQQTNEIHLAYLAMSLNRLAICQSAIGQRHAALLSSTEAVELNKTLAQARPDIFVPTLAMSLNTLSIRQSHMGHRESALSTAIQAVDYYKVLSQSEPGTFLPDLATSLDNLASRQSDMGQSKDSLLTMLEAIDLRRKLVYSNPDTFLFQLAKSLNNFACFQSKLGLHEEAFLSASEAVENLRMLNQVRPDTFLPELARSLNTLAKRYSNLGQYHAALSTALEAVELRRLLVQTRSDVFLPDLARSLNTLMACQYKLGLCEAALLTGTEAVGYYRTLAHSKPDVYLSELADSLNDLANRQGELGNNEAALSNVIEAIEHYRILIQQQPDVFLPDLASSLNNLANFKSEVDQIESALKAAAEAVEHYKILVQKMPDAFLPKLAGSLNTLSNCQSKQGLSKAALSSVLEAVDHYRVLTQTQPDAFVPYLAMSLNNLSIRQSELGQDEAALAGSLEAVQLLSPYFFECPQAHIKWIANMLGNYFRNCKVLELTPDVELVGPIIKTFNELKQE
ncbi:tetratricopeptide repeat protein [Pseudoalteromonas rubra]|uniref:tetratricopeptide repeat protein n=1 Tax=Pseudoalteromonas rubra TaxID=43658 RepID=UPI0013DDD1F1|nr:tetratricopeptide repeat protein [Pseudoalteromonas rubra]